MALVLFEPFHYSRLKDLGYVHTVRTRRKYRAPDAGGVDILDEVTRGHPVLLNRARPYIDCRFKRLSPSSSKGSDPHPSVVCHAYNADFDGDRCVHIPLSVEAQMDAHTHARPEQIFSPSSGKPITTPSQHYSCCYYMTQNPRGAKKVSTPAALANAAKWNSQWRRCAIKTHDRIRYRKSGF